MRTATVGDVQKNFSKVLQMIHSGEELIITRNGKPVAKLTALGPKTDIDWPDFYSQALEVEGKAVSEIVIEGRGERF